MAFEIVNVISYTNISLAGSIHNALVKMVISDRRSRYKYTCCFVLMAKLNPSLTHNSDGMGGGAQVFTDDVSLRVFMEHCKFTYLFLQLRFLNALAGSLTLLPYLLYFSDETCSSDVVYVVMFSGWQWVAV